VWIKAILPILLFLINFKSILSSLSDSLQIFIPVFRRENPVPLHSINPHRRKASGCRAWALALAVAGIALFRAAPGHAVRLPEYQLKAVFLFNFAKFVEWPVADSVESTTGHSSGVLSIGILGDDPFGDAFDAIEGQWVGGRILAITRADRLQELEACQILFVPSSEEKRLERVVAYFRGRNALLVGETEGFAHRGGMINFFYQGNKIRFEVNVDVIEETDLKVSAKLLKLARIVRGQGSEGGVR